MAKAKRKRIFKDCVETRIHKLYMELYNLDSKDAWKRIKLDRLEKELIKVW